MEGQANTPEFEVYEDKAGGWRWRFVAGNGQIMADSGQSYTEHSNARRAARRFKDLVAEAPLEDVAG